MNFDVGTNLEIVAFGSRCRDHSLPKPLYFMQSEVRVLGSNKTKLHAEEVGYKYVKDEDLAPDLLAYEERDFNASSRMARYQGGDDYDSDGASGW
jgi:hypothetical protein